MYNVNVFNATETVHLKMVKMVYFMLCIFYHNIYVCVYIYNIYFIYIYIYNICTCLKPFAFGFGW